jgi:hypothetical protein
MAFPIPEAAPVTRAQVFSSFFIQIWFFRCKKSTSASALKIKVEPAIPLCLDRQPWVFFHLQLRFAKVSDKQPSNTDKNQLRGFFFGGQTTRSFFC